MTETKNIQEVRLRSLYNHQFRQELKDELSLKSIMQVPRIDKIVLNMGFGDILGKSQQIDEAYENLFLITGQKPVKTMAKNAISNFHIRKGMVVGAKVTLRRAIMFEFLDRLINIVIPRIKDFNGFSLKSFDKYGNYSFGIKENLIFPEINMDKVSNIHGLGIVFSINSLDVEHSILLLKKFNFPFKK